MLIEIEINGSSCASIQVPREEFDSIMLEESALCSIACLYGKYFGISISDFSSIQTTESGARLMATEEHLMQMRRFRLSRIGI